jgi:hypothetical protein
VVADQGVPKGDAALKNGSTAIQAQ